MDFLTMINLLQTEKMFYYTTNQLILEAIHIVVSKSAMDDLPKYKSGDNIPIYVFYKYYSGAGLHLCPDSGEKFPPGIFSPPLFSDCEYNCLQLHYDIDPNLPKEIYQIKNLKILLISEELLEWDRYTIARLPSHYLTFLHFALPGTTAHLHIKDPLTIVTYRNYITLNRLTSIYHSINEFLQQS